MAAGAVGCVTLAIMTRAGLGQTGRPLQVNTATTVAYVLIALSADVKKGEKVFKKCRACHVVDKEKNKVGPHLVALVRSKIWHGRKVQILKGHERSRDRMVRGDFVGIPQEAQKVRPWLEDGVCRSEKKEAQISDLIAHLQAATKKPD